MSKIACFLTTMLLAGSAFAEPAPALGGSLFDLRSALGFPTEIIESTVNQQLYFAHYYQDSNTVYVFEAGSRDICNILPYVSADHPYRCQ
ncbi:hypothetical protein SIN8267_03194 [Sinobacterium norvegicum]|uniref:Uncharacterized protein n=1 Tax=Sinobacterium norvegicum TaxID=1641715 RepID=A0ABM9AIS8_9GAMM|nr:hypothetical protein [Sinobacterium norvegicum]CAH0993055.1 hypothetical protein SIN8267_03194 [Sinobacterium norvegicum]